MIEMVSSKKKKEMPENEDDTIINPRFLSDTQS